MRQPRRTREGLRAAFVHWFALREGDRLAPPEESLGVQRVPQSEAGWERPSDLRCDAEVALRRCSSIPFEHAMITFQVLSSGGKFRDRKRIAERFGILPSEVKKIEERTLVSMVRFLNGG